MLTYLVYCKMPIFTKGIKAKVLYLFSFIVSRTVSPAGSSSFWNQSPSLMDHSSVLSKYQYQIACRSPQQTKVKGDDIDEPASYLAEEVSNVEYKTKVLPLQCLFL